MKIKVRYHFSLTQSAKILKLNNMLCWQGYGGNSPLIYSCGSENLDHTYKRKLGN